MKPFYSPSNISSAILASIVVGLVSAFLCGLFLLAVFSYGVSPPSLTAYTQATMMHERGLIMRQTGDLTGAIKAFEASITLAPGFVPAHFSLGWTYYDLDQPAQAAAAFEEAIQLDPGLADAHYGLGWACHHLGEPRKALQSFREALRLEPALSMPHIFQLGRSPIT